MFGKEGLANTVYRGIGLFYFDYGMSYEALTLLALVHVWGPVLPKKLWLSCCRPMFLV